MKIINLDNNNEVNKNFIKINNRFKSIDIYLNSNSTKSLIPNQNPKNNQINPNVIKRINKYKVNKMKINDLTNDNSNAKNNNDKDINTTNKSNIKLSPETKKKD